MPWPRSRICQRHTFAKMPRSLIAIPPRNQGRKTRQVRPRIAASNTPGSPRPAVRTARYSPPNSRKMPTKIASVTPNLASRARVPFMSRARAACPYIAQAPPRGQTASWRSLESDLGPVIDGPARRGVNCGEANWASAGFSAGGRCPRRVPGAGSGEASRWGAVRQDQGGDRSREVRRGHPEGDEGLARAGEELYGGAEQERQQEGAGEEGELIARESERRRGSRRARSAVCSRACRSAGQASK